MLPVTSHHARHCTSGDFGLIDTCVGGIRSVFSLLVSAINAQRPEAEVNDRCYKDQASKRDHDLVCSHGFDARPLKPKMISCTPRFLFLRCIFWVRVIDNTAAKNVITQGPQNAYSGEDCDKGNDPVHRGYIGAFSAISSLGCGCQAATHRRNHPAFSAYISSHSQPANVSLPKRKDITWLTMISQNQHRTGPIAFHWIADRGRAVWGSLLVASSSCLLCFTPSLAVQAFQQHKTQARLEHQQQTRHQYRPNNTSIHHSPPNLPQSASRALGFFVSALQNLAANKSTKTQTETALC